MKHSILKAGLYGLFLCLILSGCSDNGPAKSELRQSLAVQLPSFLSVESFEVQASQNAGTQVEPVYETRFNAVIKINEDTYTEAGKENNILFVMPQKKSQDTVKVFGKTTSRLYAGTWKTAINLDGEPLRSIGKPLGAFSAQRIMVKGSPEEKQYRAEVQKAAEEARLAQEKKEQQRLEYIRQARQLLVGRWRYEHGVFLLNKDGTGKDIFNNGEVSLYNWSVDGDIVTVNSDNRIICQNQIIEISPNNYKFKNSRDDKIYNAKRIE